MNLLDLIPTYQDDGSYLDTIKFYAFCAVMLTLFTFAWIKLYIIPHGEFREVILACQLDINDMSYEGYEYCVAVNRPTE